LLALRAFAAQQGYSSVLVLAATLVGLFCRSANRTFSRVLVCYSFNGFRGGSSARCLFGRSRVPAAALPTRYTGLVCGFVQVPRVR